MPHIDANIDVSGEHLGIVDLRIERYPIPEDEKKKLFKSFSEDGVVGKFKEKLIHFKPDYSAEIIDNFLASKFSRLPDGWEDHIIVVNESKLPSMKKVFVVK